MAHYKIIEVQGRPNMTSQYAILVSFAAFFAKVPPRSGTTRSIPPDGSSSGIAHQLSGQCLESLRRHLFGAQVVVSLAETDWK